MQHLFLFLIAIRETEQYAKREEVWQQIEELARKKNPQFENLINQMDYLSLSQNNNDFTNEDDFSNEKIDQYSKDVSWQVFRGCWWLKIALKRDKNLLKKRLVGGKKRKALKAWIEILVLVKSF